jgi:hypothetical protein
MCSLMALIVSGSISVLSALSRRFPNLPDARYRVEQQHYRHCDY